MERKSFSEVREEKAKEGVGVFFVVIFVSCFNSLLRVSKGSQERTFLRLNLIACLFAGGAKRGLRKGKLRFGY